MKLAYYSTRRDRKSGWMQLELGAGGARVRLDSRIAGFDRLVRRAARGGRRARHRAQRGDGRQSGGARRQACRSRERAR